MGATLTHKLIRDHLVEGEMRPGADIALRIDQTLTQDATGTLVMLAFEALGVERVRTELSAQYVDHNILQADNKNPDDHLFLLSACRRYGIHFCPPGDGVSHPVHMQRFGVPGKTLLGSDSHTPAAGSLGMLAMGAGGLDVAMAMAGEPYELRMPEVWGVELRGELPEWVSAKDIILEMLRRHGVSGGLGRIIEYHGPGLDGLSAMDRHVIANMGTELGATTTVFPSDSIVRRFLAEEGREADWVELSADPDARYDVEETIDLSQLVPLIALPSSPGNVVPVEEVAGAPIYQAYIGSSANPGYRDFAVAAAITKGQRVPAHVSYDINPTSRELLTQLLQSSALSALIEAGARIHQAGCNGCIGMGQAPATGRISLRTVPRNFPARSGTREDSVYLCSPETAAASALKGVITDPRTLGRAPSVGLVPPRVKRVEPYPPPAPAPGAEREALVMGPNIEPIPPLEALPELLEMTVLLSLGDDVSTDEILPAGAAVLPYRSNIPAIAEFCFSTIDETYPTRAKALDGGFHAILAGDNYGQGSSREHAALAPRYLGLRMVLARSFARIHRKNLVNYGVLPLLYMPDGLEIELGDRLRLRTRGTLESQGDVRISVEGKGELIVRHDLSARELRIIRAGGRITEFAGLR